MSDPSWLIDKSALVRLGASPHAEQWADRIQRGRVHITAVTLLEVGYSARSGKDMDRALRTPPLSAMPVPAGRDRARGVHEGHGRMGRKTWSRLF